MDTYEIATVLTQRVLEKIARDPQVSATPVHQTHQHLDFRLLPIRAVDRTYYRPTVGEETGRVERRHVKR